MRMSSKVKVLILVLLKFFLSNISGWGGGGSSEYGDVRAL